MGSTTVEKILEIDHCHDGIEIEADEMWKCEMRNTVCCPRTMMIHLRDTSAADQQAVGLAQKHNLPPTCFAMVRPRRLE